MIESSESNYVYDQINNVSSVAYSNGVTHAFGYDTRYRTTSLNLTNASSSVYTQTFSDSGHKKTVAESSGRGENYAYDLIYRLKNETIAGDPTPANNGSLAYGLDPVANRQTLTSTLAALPSQSFAYDADDRLSVDTYDANGNTLTSGGVTYTYDFEDRLLSTSTGVQIVYDGDGNRVAQTATGVTTRYLVDEQTPTGYDQVAEDLTGPVVSGTFVYGVASLSQYRNGLTYWYGYDAGDSIRSLYNSVGAATDNYTYDAFGNALSVSGTVVNPLRYRGQPFDQALGLVYLRARFMNPRSGRFINGDTFEGVEWRPLSLHRYSYAHGDPVNFKDPTGQFEIGEWGAVTVKTTFLARLVVAGIATVTGTALVVSTIVGPAVRFEETTGKFHAQGSDFGRSQIDSGTGKTAEIYSVGSYPSYAAHALIESLRASLTDEQISNRLKAFDQAHKYIRDNAPISARDQKSWPSNIQREATRQTKPCKDAVDCRIDFELFTGRIY